MGIGKLVDKLLGFLLLSINLEGVSHVDDLASSSNCLDHLFSVLVVKLLNRVVRGNDKVSVQ